MNALRAFQKVEKAAAILTWGWLINNLVGLISVGVLIYLIWWQWHLRFWGILALPVGIWVVNCVVLPALFSIINKPFAEMAKSGAVRLATLGAIDDDTVRQLADTKLEHWPRVIASSMTNEEFQERIVNS